MTDGVIFSVGVRVPGEGMGNHAYHLLNGLDRHHLLQRAFVMQYQEAATPLPQAATRRRHSTRPEKGAVHAVFFFSRLC